MPRIVSPSPRRSRVPVLYREEWSFGALTRRLDPDWRVLRHVMLTDATGTESYGIDVAVLHEDHGIALIAVRRHEYTFAELAVRLAQEMLADSGVFGRFPGVLPVVFLSVEPRRVGRVPSLLLEAFAAAPPIGVMDRRWVDAAWETLSAAVVDEPLAVWTPEGADAGDDSDPRPRPAPGPARRLPGPVRTAAIVGAFGLSLATAAGVAVQFVAVPGSAQDALPSRPVGGIRLLSEAAVADYLGLRPGVFRARYEALRATGFPAPEPITGNYDKQAIDRWLDRNTSSKQSS